MSLKARLGNGEILLAPGVYDALTALLAAGAGFEALYVTGGGIAYTKLGRPDIGLVSLAEVAEVITLMRDRVDRWLIVDGDNGFGNALNVQRTVRLFERAGANAIQLEDQEFPKRCGHLAGKKVIPRDEMAGKVKAAVDARHSAETLIIARTDAIAVEGFEAAVDRAEAYLAAGADMLFIEAPRTMEQLETIGRRFARRVPLMANMVEGGHTPMRSSAELAGLGFSFVIFPGGIVRMVAKQAQAFYANLAATGSTAAFRDRMFDFDGLNQVLGTPELLEEGRAYEAAE